MKKIMKILSVGISALIGMSTLTVTASAETNLSAEYLLNDENVVWEYGNGTRCYENGEMINVGNHEYLLYIVPAADVTAEDLGVEFKELSWHIEFKNLSENTKAVAAENRDELTALCDKAQTWYDDGLVNYVHGFELVNYVCVNSAELIITLKEADKDYDPTEEYEWLEDAEVEHNDTYDEFKILGYDNTKLPEISEQINADERVEEYLMTEFQCAVSHIALDSILSLKRTFIGDITGDCSVNLYDAIEISKYVMNMVEFDEDTLSIADYNADGEVNLYDVIDIAKTLM